MRAEERAQQAEASISMRELLCSPTLRAPLLIGVVMQLSQQLSGINAVNPRTPHAHRPKHSPTDPTLNSGLLLLDVAVHVVGPDRGVSQVRHDGNRRHHGGHDAGLFAFDGPHWAQDAAPIRARRHVHLLHLHHYIVSDQGKRSPSDAEARFAPGPR